MADDTNNQNPTPVAPISVPVAAPVVNQNLDNSGSRVFKISIRAWIAVILVLTFCASIFLKIQVSEYYESLLTMILSFYFGHQLGQASNNSNKN